MDFDFWFLFLFGIHSQPVRAFGKGEDGAASTGRGQFTVQNIEEKQENKGATRSQNQNMEYKTPTKQMKSKTATNTRDNKTTYK